MLIPVRNKKGFAIVLLGLAVALVLGCSAARGSGAALDGEWVGTYAQSRFGAIAVPMVVRVAGRRADYSLPGGHSRGSVQLAVRGKRIAFTLPSRPAFAFSGTVAGRRITGTWRHGPVRGRFALNRRRATGSVGRQPLLGLYELTDGRAVAIHELTGIDAPFNGAKATVYDSGEFAALVPGGGSRFVVGAGIGVRAPERGVAQIDGKRIDWLGVPGTRVALREEEVRFSSRGVSLAGTLTLPSGSGPFPAVAVVHGSGSTPRTYGQAFTQFFVRAGVAVLAYDKRGVAQSGGRWPGEAASPQNVDVYARDAEAAVRFLAAHPRVDAARVGLWGASQAGWIIPVAATREPRVAFAVIGVGPVVTEGEQVAYSQHTTQGAQAPQSSPEEIERAMDAARTGFDPVPFIRQMRVPALWVFGGLDQHVPTPRSIRALERIKAETGRDFTWQVFPNAPHSLLETGSGLLASNAAAPSLARGMLSAIRQWLDARGF